MNIPVIHRYKVVTLVMVTVTDYLGLRKTILPGREINVQACARMVLTRII